MGCGLCKLKNPDTWSNCGSVECDFLSINSRITLFRKQKVRGRDKLVIVNPQNQREISILEALETLDGFEAEKDQVRGVGMANCPLKGGLFVEYVTTEHHKWKSNTIYHQYSVMQFLQDKIFNDKIFKALLRNHFHPESKKMKMMLHKYITVPTIQERRRRLTVSRV